MNAAKLILSSIPLLLACEDPGTCLAAPDLPRTACSSVTIGVVTHAPADMDDAALAAQVEEADGLLRPHGIRLELEWAVTERYVPYLDATTCDAFDWWGARISEADDNRIHIWAMREIRRGSIYFEGVAQPEHHAIAMLPNAERGTGAHEIGHVLGLLHEDDPADMMYPIITGHAPDFSSDQGATMLAHACALAASQVAE